VAKADSDSSLRLWLFFLAFAGQFLLHFPFLPLLSPQLSFNGRRRFVWQSFDPRRQIGVHFQTGSLLLAQTLPLIPRRIGMGHEQMRTAFLAAISRPFIDQFAAQALIVEEDNNKTNTLKTLKLLTFYWSQY
jgi:hypothetical protein